MAFVGALQDMNMEDRLIKAGDITLHCRLSGPDGAPWITLLNSIASNVSMWDGQVAALSADYRVLLLDARGHGESTATPPPYGFDLLVGDVIALWDALSITRSHVIGLSLGGMIAAGLALARPDRLGGVVIANSMMEATPAFVESWDARITLAREHGIDAVVEPTLARWLTSAFIETQIERVAAVRTMIRSTSLDGFIGTAEALKTLDYRKRLTEITRPCLFIAGREDIACPVAGIKAEAALVTGAQYAELSPAAHISNLEQPDDFTRAVLDFLKPLD
jgi:3-oxoadipate enol-lactonase